MDLVEEDMKMIDVMEKDPRNKVRQMKADDPLW